MGKSLIVQTLVICLMGRWWVEREKMRLIKENVWSGNPKQKKKNLWHGEDVAQLERNNNKCYALVFRYIYIYIYSLLKVP